MKVEKMSLKNIKDVLNRDEMRTIMAGSGGGGCSNACKDSNNNVLGTLTPSNCDTAFADCRAKWSTTDTSVCSCS